VDPVGPKARRSALSSAPFHPDTSAPSASGSSVAAISTNTIEAERIVSAS
jgi:hypothetical protein